MKPIWIDVKSPSENHLFLIGVPFVEGTFHEEDNLELKCGETQLLLWYTIRNIWKDGSIRWVFLHTWVPAGDNVLSVSILKGHRKDQSSVDISDNSLGVNGCQFSITVDGFTFETGNGSVSYSADTIDSNLSASSFHPSEADISLVEASPIAPLIRIREEGKGFRYLLHGLNPERILISAESIGIGRAALTRASQYAKDRVVFDRPIGQNQAIQHPLAESWCELEAANLMCFKAATLYDAGASCGVEANAAKFLAAQAGFTACERSILTHGGYGYAKEFHVERFMREQWINRVAPVTEHLMLCHIAERALGLPKSY